VCVCVCVCVLSTCSWAVGLADIGEDFSVLQYTVSAEGSDYSCITETG